MTIYTELGRSGLVMMEKFGENFCTFWKHIFENGRNPKKKKKIFFQEAKILFPHYSLLVNTQKLIIHFGS